MIQICLTKFTNGPWEEITIKAFNKALTYYKNKFEIDIIKGYPQKKYDIIILVGIRSIVKRKLDPNKILPYCKKLVDMGDSGMDPRNNFEDLYFYFLPSKNKLYDHYVYLPKYIIPEKLYPEKFNDDKLTIYVDHFKYQNEDEREMSIKAINKVFYLIRNSNIPLRVFYHTSKGIELNRLTPEITKTNVQIAKYLTFDEIAKYYRKTDIFFPTHRETQGMVAQEIAACGGITILQEWMYPKNTLSQFAHILYKENDDIDFLSIKNNIKNITHEEIRNNTLRKCNFENFRNTLCQSLINLIENN